MKTLALPTAVAAAAGALHIPSAVSGTGMAAATILGAGIETRRTAREERRSAAGYLLGLQQTLTPSGLLQRLGRTLRPAP